jgi:predicted RNA binding protein YcfA (HicA-like mRNA interferase family)
MKVRDLMRLLESRGWRCVRQKGSHRQFKHDQRSLLVTVPGSEGKDIPLGTLKAILKAAGLDRLEGR